ncbi:hypothetical protein [Pararhizobium haloflavum]|uniref:hypothetical protein n=1 Tax=Pararhizobium haloflavum TaxID=2037914 RepID=UPI0012FFEA9C|nr:hypothetical protein [Pararhizobium haloflavum]
MRHFFRNRWDGTIPLATLLWRDMVIVASLINLAFFGGAIVALEMGAPIALAVLFFAAPIPYNIFLWGALWRTSARTGGAAAAGARLIATLWLFLAILI